MITCITIATFMSVILPCIHSQSLRTPPEVRFPTKHTAEYHIPSTDITLNCTAVANPNPRYRWTLNGQRIGATGGPVTVNPETGLLTITGYTRREEGSYQCQAYNDYTPSIQPTALSPVIDVITVGFGPKKEEVKQSTVEGKEGDYASLPCINTPISVPRAKYSWYIESSGGNKQQVGSDNNRIFVDNEGTLHFLYLEMNDEPRDASNVYKCGMFNSQLDRIDLASPTALTVLSGSKSQVKPTLQYWTDKALFRRTQTAELECVFSGIPKPEITWSNQLGKIVPSEKYQFESNGMRLRINNLEEGASGDTGAYECKGSNTVGEESGTVYLQVMSGPIWTEALNYLTIPVGFDARFTCKAREPFGGNFQPLNEPVWFKNGVKMRVNSDGKHEWSEGKSVLTIRNVQKNVDVMCVQCNVSNEFGFEFDNGCLNVIDPIVVERRPEEVQKIKKGDAVDLTVTGSTDSALTLKYRWVFKNVSYDNTPPPHVTYDMDTNKAYINTSGLTDQELDEIAGVYNRILYHQYQNVSVKTEVVLARTTPVPIVAEGSFPWWVIILVVVLLVLIVAVIIIVLCCCRHKDKGDYVVYKREVNATYLNPDKDIEDNKFHDVARIDDDGAGDDVKKPLRLGPNFDLSGEEADSLDAYQGGGRVSHA